jgi:hypothetical protein
LAKLRRLAPDLPDSAACSTMTCSPATVAGGDRISGALDWGSASFGDPLPDPARQHAFRP